MSESGSTLYQYIALHVQSAVSVTLLVSQTYNLQQYYRFPFYFISLASYIISDMLCSKEMM